MPKNQPTLTVSVDDRTFEVASMSQEAQQLIAYMDEWRQKEADATSDLLMVRAAIHDIQNTLLATIRESEAAAAEAAPVAAPEVSKAKPQTKKVAK